MRQWVYESSYLYLDSRVEIWQEGPHTSEWTKAKGDDARLLTRKKYNYSKSLYATSSISSNACIINFSKLAAE